MDTHGSDRLEEIVERSMVVEGELAAIKNRSRFLAEFLVYQKNADIAGFIANRTAIARARMFRAEPAFAHAILLASDEYGRISTAEEVVVYRQAQLCGQIKKSKARGEILHPIEWLTGRIFKVLLR